MIEEYDIDRIEIYLIDPTIDIHEARYRARGLLQSEIELEHAERLIRHDDRVEMVMYHKDPVALAVAPSKEL